MNSKTLFVSLLIVGILVATMMPNEVSAKEPEKPKPKRMAPASQPETPKPKKNEGGKGGDETTTPKP